jgi:hypothetical protein
MGTLYDELGVGPDASADELRRAYYRRARELHPDVNPAGRTDEAMRRVNQAWAILGHPVSRRRYDLQLAHSSEARAASPARPAPPPPSPERPVPDDLPVHISLLARLLRPSALILAVLLVIFVVTAYAGQAGHTRSPTTTTSSTSVDLTQGAAPGGPLPAPMGNCLLSQTTAWSSPWWPTRPSAPSRPRPTS